MPDEATLYRHKHSNPSWAEECAKAVNEYADDRAQQMLRLAATYKKYKKPVTLDAEKTAYPTVRDMINATHLEIIDTWDGAGRLLPGR